MLPIAELQRTYRAGRAARRRLPPAIPAAPCATVSACRDGPARRFGEPPILPIWRRAENDLKRHLSRLPFVRVVQDHGRHEQIGTVVSVGGGMDTGGDWYAYRVCRTFL